MLVVRTVGLWGSGFSFAAGRYPDFGATVRRGVLGILSGALFFAPRRPVTIEVTEPALPRPEASGFGGRFTLLDAYPNPFRTATCLHFDVATRARVGLTIVEIDLVGCARATAQVLGKRGEYDKPPVGRK